MRKIKRIFFISLPCVLLIVQFMAFSAFAQQSKFLSAVVIADRDYFRSLPLATSSAQTAVVKGAKLKVMEASVKGWYFAYLEEAPTVMGYIHGNSIRVINTQKNNPIQKPTVPKGRVTVLPKSIILDDSEYLEPNVKKPKSPTNSSNNKISKQTPTRSNYCQPPLYCPDIDEVQVALFDNVDKFQKGKFEKSADWEKRKPTILRDLKLREGRTVADKMYFLFEQGLGSMSYDEPQYDADRELWSFPLNFEETATETCIPIFSQSTGQILCLIVPQKMGTKVKAFVSMPPATAAGNDKKLQIAFVGKIVEPYIWSNKSTTIKDISSGIYFQLEEIICINPKTGGSWKVDIPTITDTKSKITVDSKSKVNLNEVNDIDEIKRILMRDPKNSEGHLQLGKIYAKQSDYENAIIEFKTALLWNERLIQAHIELGYIYFIQGNCAQAQIYSKSALEIDSENKEALGLKRIIEKCSQESGKSTNAINSISIPEPRLVNNQPKPTEPSKSPTFEGNWKMQISAQNQTLPVTLIISRQGKKYKGILVDDKNQYSNSFDIKFDGRNFKFTISTVHNYLKVVIRSEGYFEGDNINASMTFKSLFNNGTVSFNGTKANE